MKIYITFLFFIGCILNVVGQTRKYSNEFLTIGVDAAALGRSNTVVSSTKDVNAGYWNPAGLTQLKNKQIAIQHASYFANIANYDYAAYAAPLDKNTAIGISLIRFGVDDILDTRALIQANGDITPFRDLPKFSTADYAFTFSYARIPFNKNISFGVNAKVIRRIIGDFASSWGFGLDAGIQGKTANKKWSYGIVVKDITTSYNSWKIDGDIFDNILPADEDNALTRQEAPEKTEITLPSVQLGLGRDLVLNRDLLINVEADLNVRFAQTNDLISTAKFSAAPAVGFQFSYKNLAFLRGGVGNFQKEKQFDQTENISFQPNFGVGFQYRGVAIDYALTDIGNQSAAIYSNIFSLRIDWSIFQ